MGPIPPTGTTERTTASGWGENARAAFVVRTLVYSAPLIVAFFATWLVTRWWPAPDSGIQAVLRFVVLAAMAMTVGAATDTIARKFLPLAALLRLSLVFPDQAPSRFIIALRSGSARSLKKRLAELESPDFEGTEDRAARLIVELSAALSRHDRLTRGHSERVRAYTALIAQEMELSAEDSNKLQWAALIHDVGKLKIPYEILTKPGKLTDREYATIQTHATQGMYIAAPLAEFLGPWFGAIGEHHERFDGAGYPNGLHGEEISLGARIVAVADAYDVMTAAQSYKKPMSAALARQELADCAGTQFDPMVVRAFLHVGLGAVRRSMWPLSWVLQVPFIGGAVAAPVTQAVTATVLTLATATGVTAATGGFEPVDIPAAIAFVQSGNGEVEVADRAAAGSTTQGGPPSTITTTTTTLLDELLPGPTTSTGRTTTTADRNPGTSTTETTAAPTTSEAVRPTSTTEAQLPPDTTTTEVEPPVVTTSMAVAPAPETTTTTTEVVAPITDCEQVQAGERNLPGADLSGCALASVELSGGNFNGANFDGAELSAVSFAGASLVGTSFDGADLTGVVFDDADMGNASFRQAIITDTRFLRATLIEVDFQGATFEFGSMDHAVLTRADFVGARLIQWSIKEANLANANFSNAEFVDSLVKYSNADGAKFVAAQIGGLWIYGSSFVEADFTDATGTPEGSESAVFDGTLCPNGEPTWTSCW